MGKRQAAEAEFDLQRSSVTTHAGTVELLLASPRWEDVRAGTYLQLKQAQRSVRGLLVAEQQGASITAVRCSVPRAKLDDGQWELNVQTLAGPQPIGADLVVWRGRLDLRSDGLTCRERLVAAGAKALDAALAPLPASRARAIRGKARKIARTLFR